MGCDEVRKGVWILLICLAVSIGDGGGRGVLRRGGRLARGDTSCKADYCMSAIDVRVPTAAYLACPMNALRSICLREIEPLDRAEWTLSLIVPEYKPRPLRTSSTLNHEHLYL